MKKPKWRQVAARILRFLAVLYLAMILAVCLAQRRLLYVPTRIPPATGTNLAATAGFQAWQNSSGQYIGWKQAAKTAEAHGRILIIHGNAGSAIDRLSYADGLKALGPLDVYILEYPGYGPRDGSPSQTSLFQAAAEALELLKKDGPVYLMGESLGTGVASYLAGTFPEAVRSLLLIAPYHNMGEVAQHHFPILPVKWLLLDKFPSATYLQNYHGPLAVLLAGNDEVIPKQFGQRLFDAYPGPKKVWEVSAAGHNDLIEQPAAWWRELAGFWKENEAKKSP
jgi:pimeloyl-ACP methyl ester carboxylesterase